MLTAEEMEEALAELRSVPEKKRRRRRRPEVEQLDVRPTARLEPVVVEEQFDAEGDILWAVSGRGPALFNYSLAAVETEALARLEQWERDEISRRNGCTSGFVRFVPAAV